MIPFSTRPRLLALLVAIAVVVPALATVPTATATGEVYVTDSGLEVTDSSPGVLPDGNPFLDSETLRLPGIELSSSGSASLTLLRRNGSYTNVSSIDASSPITVDPDDKQAVVLESDYNFVAFGSIDYSSASAGDGIIYDTGSTATLTVKGTGLGDDTHVEAVDVNTGDRVDFGCVDGSGDVTLSGLPSGNNHVRLNATQNGTCSSSSSPSPDPPSMSVSPESLALGNVTVGDNASAEVTVSNDGDESLSVNEIRTVDTDETAFAVTPAETTIEGGASDTVELTFAPTAAGNYSGSLRLEANDPSLNYIDVPFSATAGAGDPRLDTNRTDFGNVTLGDAETRTITLRNAGNATITVQNLTVNGSRQFVATNDTDNTTISVNPGETQPLGVRFAPTALGPARATLTVETDATTNATGTVALAGRGVVGRPSTPANVSLGAVTVGSTLSRNVTVENVGNGTLTIRNATISGPAADDFGVTGATGSFAPGERRNVSVSVTPSATGTRSATLALAYANTTVTVPLSATGATGRLSVPESVAFGNVTADDTRTRNVTVENVGNGTLGVRNATLSGANAGAFAVTATPESIAPNATANLTVAATPTTLGPVGANLTVESDAVGDSTATTALTARGVTGVPAVTSTVAFGNVTTGVTQTRTVTVGNTGNGTLGVRNATLSGADASAFAITATPESIAPNETANLTLAVAPTAPGRLRANLTVETDAVGRPTANSSLSALGVRPSASVSPANASFGTVATGNTSTRTLQMTADRAMNVTLGVRGSDADAFAVVGGSERAVPTNGTTNVTVRFAPADGGDRQARLVGTDTNGSRVLFDASLSGRALEPEFELDTESVTFGGTQVNETATRAITVRNTGNATLTVRRTRLAATDSDFSVTTPTPVSVPAGGSRTLTVRYAPTTPTETSTTLSILTTDPDQSSRAVWLTSTNTTGEVTVNRTDEGTSVSASVENVSAGSSVSVGVPSDTENESGVESVSFSPETNESVSVNITESTDPVNESVPQPEYKANGTTELTYINVETSVSDRNISAATVTYRVNRSQLDRWNTTAEEVTLYRYENGSWEPKNTTVRSRTNGSVVLAASAGGFSEWTAAAARPYINVTDTAVNVTAATTEETVSIQVLLANSGGADGVFVTKLLLNDTVVERRQVTLAANATRLVEFDRTFDQPGDYSVLVNDVFVAVVDINGSERSVAVSQTVTEVEGRTTTDPGTGDGDGGGTGVFGPQSPALAVVALVLAGLALLARRD